MKKAQGISMNVIIIAAIALIVLVILSMIFIGRMGSFGKASEDCKKLGGTCNAEQCSALDLQIHPTGECEGDNNCCMPKIA